MAEHGRIQNDEIKKKKKNNKLITRRSPSLQTPRQLQRITSDAPGPGQRYALAIAQQAHDLWEQRRVAVQFRWVPSHSGTAGNEKADEWAKMAAWNERGSEQLPYEFSSTSLAHLKRGIAERKRVEACSWIESRLSKHHAYRQRKRMRPDNRVQDTALLWL